MAFQQNHKEAGTAVRGYASSPTPKQPLRSGRPSTTLSWNQLGADKSLLFAQRWHAFSQAPNVKCGQNEANKMRICPKDDSRL